MFIKAHMLSTTRYLHFWSSESDVRKTWFLLLSVKMNLDGKPKGLSITHNESQKLHVLAAHIEPNLTVELEKPGDSSAPLHLTLVCLWSKPEAFGPQKQLPEFHLCRWAWMAIFLCFKTCTAAFLWEQTHPHTYVSNIHIRVIIMIKNFFAFLIKLQSVYDHNRCCIEDVNLLLPCLLTFFFFFFLPAGILDVILRTNVVFLCVCVCSCFYILLFCSTSFLGNLHADFSSMFLCSSRHML